MILMYRIKIRPYLIPLILTFLLSGCALLKVREDSNTLQKSIVLTGTVSSPVSYKDMPVIVAVYSREGDQIVIPHYTTLHEPGPYELMAPVGIHNLIAFIDKNKNLICDIGEPSGEIIGAEKVSMPNGGVSGNLDIVVTEQNSGKTGFPLGYKLQQKKYKKFHSTCPGAIADLDDFIFSAEFGRKGLWDGLEFFKEIGGNIYFLEEYDPNKIPVLFVHGVGGSPQDWRKFFDSIDRSRYQPWFFYYPSGSSLDSMAYLLFWKIQSLQVKYKFKEMYITAHSMGGLVVRSFLIKYGFAFPSITKFISISTPWGGEELAELGVKYSPGVVPAWRDMQPESELIKYIFSKKLSPDIDYYMFFGHKGNRNILRENNDKAVTLASQLDQRSQQDAKMIYGFNEDHVSILSSKQVMSQFNTILAQTDDGSGALDKTQGNRISVDFSFDLSEDQPKPSSTLFLRPLNGEDSVIWMYLRPADSGKIYGPFPSGEYKTYFVAAAFRPEPAELPVTIKEDSVSKVRFFLKPVGYLRGYVAESDPLYKQAGNQPRLDAKVEIESITLKGKGVNRKLIPLKDEEKTYDDIFPEHYLREEDFSLQGAFFFFGLPAGEYELSIDAKGCKPYSEKYTVEPGDYMNTIRVELQRKNGDHL